MLHLFLNIEMLPIGRALEQMSGAEKTIHFSCEFEQKRKIDFSYSYYLRDTFLIRFHYIAIRPPSNHLEILFSIDRIQFRFVRPFGPAIPHAHEKYMKKKQNFTLMCIASQMFVSININYNI